MTRKLLFAAMLASGAAGAAQAQTLLNADVPDLASTASFEQVSFSVSTASVVSESASWSLPSVFDAVDFKLVDDSTNTYRNTYMTASGATHFAIAPGNYTLYYRVEGVGDAHLGANVASAPEIDPSSAMAGLTLLGFGVTMLRSRRLTRS